MQWIQNSHKFLIRPDKLDLLFLISARFYFHYCLLPRRARPLLIQLIVMMSRETSLMASAHGHLSQARCHSFACQYYMAVGQLFRGQSLEFL